jgi:HprK-related kinase A
VRIADLAADALKTILATNGLYIRTGPFRLHIRSNSHPFVHFLNRLYADYTVLDPQFADFHVALRLSTSYRRWFHPQVRFEIDRKSPFQPFPNQLSPPLFEWGLNWCIGTRAHQYLMLHAAVLERNGNALILPAHPGSGKSTLCAALTLSGWRLFSDEFGLIDTKTLRLIPIPRPIALKNESIHVIRNFSPDAIIGDPFPKTRKGTVAHLRPSTTSIDQMNEPARPAWIVFLKYKAKSPVILEPFGKAQSLLRLANNAFNYEILGQQGFELISAMVRGCHCLALTYGNLDEVVGRLNALEVPEYA